MKTHALESHDRKSAKRAARKARRMGWSGLSCEDVDARIDDATDRELRGAKALAMADQWRLKNTLRLARLRRLSVVVAAAAVDGSGHGMSGFFSYRLPAWELMEVEP
jgi:hypothetical protein